MAAAQTLQMADLTPGMRVSGFVRGVTEFGAFIDFGAPRDGLLHKLRYKVLPCTANAQTCAAIERARLPAWWQ